jgi:hypothetical protein
MIRLPNERSDRAHVFRRTLVFGVPRMLDKCRFRNLHLTLREEQG